MIGASVVVTLPVFAELFLNVGGSLVDRRDDGSSGGIGLLPDMNRIGGKTHNDNLLCLTRLAGTSAKNSVGTDSPTSDAILDSLCGTETESGPTRARLGSFRRAEAIQFKQVTGGAQSRQFDAQEIPCPHGAGDLTGPEFPTTMRKDRS